METMFCRINVLHEKRNDIMANNLAIDSDRKHLQTINAFKTSRKVRDNQITIHMSKNKHYITQCAQIMRSLPEYFYESEVNDFLGQCKQDNCQLIVARKHGKTGDVVGFLNIVIEDGIAEIVNFAVKDGYRSKGIGEMMIANTASYCKAKGINDLIVETLDDSCDWDYYVRTRKFYREKIGFEFYKINENPTWKVYEDDIALLLRLDVNKYINKNIIKNTA